MGSKTAIQWTERTWNPVVGCEKIAAGCKHCYAKTLHDQRHEAYKAGKKLPAQYARPFEDVQLMPDRLPDPLRWQKGGMVFVNSVSDLFHKDVPDDYLFRVFAVMALAGKQTFQVLTKRVERMCDFANRLSRSVEPLERAAREMGYTFKFNDQESGKTHPLLPWPIPNVWLGASFAIQPDVHQNWRYLNDTPAVVRFASCEPLIGPLDLTKPLHLDRCRHRQKGTGHQCGMYAGGHPVDDDDHDRGHHTSIIPSGYPWFRSRPLEWVIVGGESGTPSRTCHIEGVRSVVEQCQRAKVPVFVKQLGTNPFESQGENSLIRLELRDRKGGEMDEWPADLRVRQFPNPRKA